jgi:hypothetical protein
MPTTCLSDILVYNPLRVAGPVGTETIPAVANFSCNTQRLLGGAPPGQGKITSRAQELAGPDTIPTGGVAGGYVPCHYTAPSTGIYDIEFLGPLGDSSALDGAVAADVALAAAGDFDATQGTSIAAWDATVRANLTSAVNITGRVFTYYLPLFTAGNGLPVFPSIYAVTRDATSTRTICVAWTRTAGCVRQPGGFSDSDGTTPSITMPSRRHRKSGPAGIQGGVSLASRAFFEPPSAAAIAAPASRRALADERDSFSGTVGGNTSLETGVPFFTTNVRGGYDIVISIDGVNFDLTSPTNHLCEGWWPPESTAPERSRQPNNPFPVGTTRRTSPPRRRVPLP